MATTTSAVSTTPYDTQGYVSVTWTNAEKSVEFYSWGVWRRIRNEYDTGYLSWELIYETTVDKSSYEYRDYLAPANKTVQYTVRQRTGTQTLTWDAIDNIRTVTPPGTNYWLIHPTDKSKNLLLAHVTSDDFDYEKEEEVLRLIGRGRKVDQGTRFGVQGTLKVDFRSRLELVKLVDLWNTEAALHLRNPFGDVWLVSLGKPSMDRTSGVGVQEFTDVSVSYLEVA